MSQSGALLRSEEADYAEIWENFSLDTLADCFDGDMERGINACIECCDRHVGSHKTALIFEDERGNKARYSFEELRDASARFANVLTSLGLRPGDVVSGMLPRRPELLMVILGTWRAGCVYQPVFTAFGSKSIQQRLTISQAKLIVTDPANRPKLDDVENCPAIAVYAGEGTTIDNTDDIDLRRVMARQSTDFKPVLRKGSDLFMMMATSGTTGLSKGVAVPLFALYAFYVYMRDAIDLRQDDRFWNIADPGWAYGLYYAVTGPLSHGATTLFYDGHFNARSTYDMIRRYDINNLAGAPTAYRLLIAAGVEAAEPIKGRLRVVSSAGEPLNPEVIRWFDEHLHVPIYDHYGQTELGMFVNNHHRLAHDFLPGSAGFAMPGYRVAVLDENDRELPPGQQGILAIDIGRSPLFWFLGYHNRETPAIANGYYRTGDTVLLEATGQYSFVGRDDDIITSSGYRIGPFEVESALLEHAAVRESAVVGIPDPERTEIVKAFIVLNDGFTPSDALFDDLQKYVRKRLSAHAYPRLIDFVSELPKTPSGKIQRFLLRQSALEKGASA